MTDRREQTPSLIALLSRSCPAWLLALVFCLSSLASLSAGEIPKRPNIILCMADDQGWGDVGYYGSSPVQTPVLDEMAANGLRFDRFYAAAPVCSPTRGSVMTGRHPNRFGCFSWGYSLRPQEITVAEALQEAGYLTGHFGKWHLGSTYASSPVSPGNSGFDTWYSSPNFYENDPLMSWKGQVIQAKGESSRVPVDYALDFIRSAESQDQPFLAVIWFGSPHLPHEAIDELKELYPDQPDKVAHFLGELTGIDRAMGVLRKELREMGIEKETMLWYTSDNGALKVGSTNGLRGNKGDLYEGGLRVPAIIEWPGVIEKHRVIDQVCGTVDIYPTVVDVVGAEVENNHPLDGQSLVPIIEGNTVEREQPLGFWVYPAKGHKTPSSEFLEQQRLRQLAGDFSDPEAETGKIGALVPTENPQGHAALVDGDWKLHRIPKKDSNEMKYTLYNLKKDPAEKKDVAGDNQDRVDTMKQQLSDWQTSVIESLNGEDYATEASAEQE
ncbi:sulfatase [Rubinisphaera sp. JC750]|uniref:sulfatase family protein n=1 Tax=Rubinisphaera sp. JC750 TaxID=2898658 RepID=UPI001F01DEE0|nr:sulfatase-like hydrolase/transferase [Rubinisphaera sp. JC750]